jgi:ABC-type Fe3+ transport system permease subunit
VWRHLNAYFTTYYSFRVVFIHIFPCLLLVVVNALLVNAMRHAQTRRRRLLKQNRKYDCRRLNDSQGTTLMLVTVVFFFLLVEIPLAVVLVLNMVKEMWQVCFTQLSHGKLTKFHINFFVKQSNDHS